MSQPYPPLPQELIERENAARLAALQDEYASLGRALDRRGRSIDAGQGQGEGLRRRGADLGPGRRRHALRQVPDPRRADRPSTRSSRTPRS